MLVVPQGLVSAGIVYIMSCLRIISTGVYLPEGRLTSEEAYRRSVKALNRDISVRTFDVPSRFCSTGEPISEMGERALRSALDRINLKPHDLDLIIFGSSMPEQPIPSTAVLLHRRLGLENSGIACFDVSSTCTSFLTGLQVANSFLISGAYKRIAVVCGEVGSKGINWKIPEVAALFGDGAAAAIFENSGSGSTSKVLSFLTRTYSSSSDLCQIRAGGSRLNIVTPPQDLDHYLFDMNGRGVYKAASQYLPQFLEDLLVQAQVSREEIDWIVPHQASPLAMSNLRKRLDINKDRLIDIIETHGNQVSASLPTALHVCLSSKAKRGDKILLLGTGAGLTISGAVLVY